MTMPSVLEWIIIGCMGAIVTAYCIRSIYVMIDRKKNPQKYEKKKKKKEEELDE